MFYVSLTTDGRPKAGLMRSYLNVKGTDVGRNTTLGRLCLLRPFKGCSVRAGWKEPESDIAVKEDTSKLSFPGFQLLAVILFFRRLVYKFTKSFCVWILKYNNANSWHFVLAICVTLRLGISALTACMPLHTHARARALTHSRWTQIELIDLREAVFFQKICS